MSGFMPDPFEEDQPKPIGAEMSENVSEKPCVDCKYCLRNPNFEPCASCFEDQNKFEPKCPLPRIGSKEWGWTESCDGNKWSSPLACNFDIWKHSGCSDTYFVYLLSDGYCSIGKDLGLIDAKTLVESRARRDWRKANRGKNG